MDPTATRELGRTGVRVTQLGLGGGPLGEMFEHIPEDRAAGALEAAWAGGIRYFDTSPWYGKTLSEHRFGHTLRWKPRGEFVLSTKVGRVFSRPADPADRGHPFWYGGLNFQLRFDYTRDGIMRSYEDSLQRLGMNRVDLLLIHDLDFRFHETEEGVAARLDELDGGGGFRALQELKDAGEIKGIGAGINQQVMIARLLERFPIDFLLIARPYNLMRQELLDDDMARCEAAGIGLVIGTVFASGILARGAVEGARFEYQDAPPEVLDRVRRMEAVCARHGVPLGAAALQFPLGHPSVASVIPGAVSADEVEQNLAHVRHPIPADLWAELKAEGLLREDAPVPA